MTKKEMAIIIASKFLRKSVDENNWKVKELVKLNKSTLIEFIEERI